MRSWNGDNVKNVLCLYSSCVLQKNTFITRTNNTSLSVFIQLSFPFVYKTRTDFVVRTEAEGGIIKISFVWYFFGIVFLFFGFSNFLSFPFIYDWIIDDQGTWVKFKPNIWNFYNATALKIYNHCLKVTPGTRS